MVMVFPTGRTLKKKGQTGFLFHKCYILIMNLGNFSLSLAVKDFEASNVFYEKFGFKVFLGEA